MTHVLKVELPKKAFNKKENKDQWLVRVFHGQGLHIDRYFETKTEAVKFYHEAKQIIKP